ncbi:cell division protease FtsH [Pseudarcicella hirudinis]|uniref:Cell division protease FtsH n=2 Tax=Pseudarcicella hirudinis TaxID=1079859 RepID=A0A1I5P6C5_9BACT|nr:AAA family ATPase [Pseudarcicella hirudinis]SFP29061.1 cell division protease FtsH [Pseudarcicella hirudinis]
MSKINIDLQAINFKKQRLEEIRAELKQEFIGIDYIIEELIDYLRIWYLMPEILTRPIIINLWGMTGVGKTDLVRKLVTKLEFQDRFAEIELSNNESSWGSSVARTFESNGIATDEPSIVLFDEIQRFYTIDIEGKPVPGTRYQDFWELLSDGKLAKRDVKEEIDNYLQNFLYSSIQKRKRQEKNTEEEEQEEEFGVGIWQARNLKKIFDLDGEINTLADMTEEQLLGVLQAKKEKKKVYEPIDHSKMLIIISGNLDEAYSMANETAETDLDADIFRAYTEKITLVDIKNALSRKFKPEQVARFGNIHLIYKSLRKRDFEQLIQQEIHKIIHKNHEHFGITVSISEKINQLVYQNGVFPVQGVRPVFSSITDIIESNLSKFMFEALIKEQTEIEMDYDFEKGKIIGMLGKNPEVHEINYIGKVDRIRQGNLPDIVANVSVHESGHAIAYGLLFGLAPLQLRSKIAASYAGGFTFSHQIHLTKGNITDKIKVFLAGGVAEALVFGEENMTPSCSTDLEDATNMAADYVRRYGFDHNFQAFYGSSGVFGMDTSLTDWSIEKMIRTCTEEIRELLIQNNDYLLTLAKALNAKGNLTPEEVVTIAREFGNLLIIKEENYLHLAEYQKLLEK